MISNLDPTEIWLIIGISCLMIEFILVSNIGFLFLGLGALLNAILIKIYPITFNNQIIMLGLFTLIWLAALWRPLKRYMYNKTPIESRIYSDMVGKQVEVYSTGASPTEVMQVKWSGTIMNALLEKNSEAVRIEDKIFVKEVQGNILICEKNKPTTNNN